MVTNQNKISRKIVEKLRLRREKIISKEEIFQMMMEYQRIYQKKVNMVSMWVYLRKSHYIQHILGIYYYIYSLEERYNHYCQYSEEERLFLVLEKMKIKWYLGLERALREHNLGWQALSQVPIINTHFSGIRKVGNSQFRFMKTREKRCRFGLIKKRTNNGVKYFYADLEKTYLDFLYFHSYQGKDMKSVQRQLDFKVRRKRVREYAVHYSGKIREAL